MVPSCQRSLVSLSRSSLSLALSVCCSLQLWLCWTRFFYQKKPSSTSSTNTIIRQWEPTGSRLLNPSLDWEHAWTTLNDGAEAKAGGATIDAADNTGEVDAVDFKKILIGIAKKKPEHLCEGINDHSDSLTLLMGAVNYQDLDVVEVTYEIVSRACNTALHTRARTVLHS